MTQKISLGLTALFLGVALVFVSSGAQAQVQLKWKDNSPAETSFVIERATSSSGPWTSIGTAGANATTFTDQYAVGGTTYYYRVKALNSSWTSRYTNVATKIVAPVAAGSGVGLQGQYYKDNALSSLVRTQTDAQVGFDWGTGSPGSSLPVDNFSVRWSGKVQTFEGGTYNFSTESDDGVRLWVNNVLVIDKWSAGGTYNANVVLAANTKYLIKMEYVERTGSAYARLKWKRPGATSTVLIPKSQLFTS